MVRILSVDLLIEFIVRVSRNRTLRKGVSVSEFLFQLNFNNKYWEFAFIGHFQKGVSGSEIP